MLDLLTYPPVLRGLILLAVSGFTFPLGGVFILRMNILPLRYLLMHGVLLGGAIGLATGSDPSLVSFFVNLVLILLLNRSSRLLKTDYGHLSMFFMVAAVAAASVVMAVFHVPAKDTLVLLWGSLYAGTTGSIVAAAAVGAGTVVFVLVFFRHLTVVFHDGEVAASLGIRVAAFELSVMFITALIVASAMRLMGALLLDALLILPVVIAGLLASGLRRTMVYSCLFGGLFSLAGFFISLLFDIPVSAGVAIPAAVVFLIVISVKRGRKYGTT